MKQTKRMLCLALSLIMLLSLFPASALADESVILSASEESQDDVLDVPNDDAALDEEDEVLRSAQDDEDAPALVRVVFVCEPAETVVTVYDPAQPDENGEPTVIDPEEDGSWMMTPGTYLYDAVCEGCMPVEKEMLSVAARDEAGYLTVSRTLEAAEDTVDIVDAKIPPLSVDDLFVDAVTTATNNGTVVASGECGAQGDNVTWTLYDDGSLVISGTGAIRDIGTSATLYDDQPWYNHKSSIISISIGYGVTSIGDRAFYGCSTSTSVTIPSSVMSIGNSAFCMCRSLASVTIPSSVASIGEAAFYGCSTLTSMTIPSSVRNIANDTFYSCSAMTSVTIPEGVASIGEAAFYGCSALTSVTIPEGVTSIGDYAFCDCTVLTSVTIPEGVTSIGNYVFYGCEDLTSVTIPSSVTSIGLVSFAWSGVESIDVAESNKKYRSEDGVLIDKETDILLVCPPGRTGAFAIPEGVTGIEEGAFFSCENLTSVTLPSSLTSIESFAFGGCGNLTSVTLPEGVTSIKSYAFYFCENLISVTIPSSMTSIESSAFAYCYSITDVYYGGTREQKNTLIGNGWSTEGNDELYNATWHFRSSQIFYLGEVITQLDKGLDEIVFQTASTTYNPELVFYLSALDQAAYHKQSLYDSLYSLRFSEIDQEYTDDQYPAFTFAKMPLSDGRTIVMIVVRGTANAEQWIYTNFDLGVTSFYIGGVHKGFAEATNKLLSYLQSYMGGNWADPSVTYVVTGHSLGAAVANLTSYALANSGVSQANIYNYNIACPDVVKNTTNIEYANMFNIADARDLVSFVPGMAGNALSLNAVSTWSKFGQSKWFSYDWSRWLYLGTDIQSHHLTNYLQYFSKKLTAVRSGDDKVNGTDALQIQRYFADISSVFDYMR